MRLSFQKEILLSLYSEEKNDQYEDLSACFSSYDREVLCKTVQELESEGLLEVDWSKYAFGYVDLESESKEKTSLLSDVLEAKLTETGTLYVENYVLDDAKKVPDSRNTYPLFKYILSIPKFFGKIGAVVYNLFTP